MFSRILVGTSGSAASERAVRVAATTARDHGARLLIVCAHRPLSAGRVEHDRRQVPEEIHWAVGPNWAADASLQRARAVAVDAGAQAVRTLAVDGTPGLSLVRAAQAWRADAVVLGGRRTPGRLFRKVEQELDCPVLFGEEVDLTAVAEPAPGPAVDTRADAGHQPVGRPAVLVPAR